MVIGIAIQHYNSTTTTAYIHTKSNGNHIFATASRYYSDHQMPFGVLGLLNLDPSYYGIAQVDVDGSLQKTILLAETMTKSNNQSPLPPQHPEVFDPTTTLPYIRSGGFSLFADDRALKLLATFGQSNTLNTNIVNSPPADPINNPTPFYAEDLVRGYRLDIWSSRDNKWHSLHLRNAVYSIGESDKYTVSSDKEEGFVQLAVTQAAPNQDGSQDTDDMFLHEAIARWTGWSLSVHMPSKHLTRSADQKKALPSSNDPTDPENEPITPFKMKTNFKIVKHSLPALRFGDRYKIRIRVVDLAGNSIELDTPVTEWLTPYMSLPHGTDSFPYLRFEPIITPYIIIRDVQAVTGNGSSTDRIIIRTFNNDPSLDDKPADLTANDRHMYLLVQA